MFTQARLKLTGLYVAVLLVITGVFSGIFYFRVVRVIEQQHDKFRQRIEVEGLINPFGSRVHQRMMGAFLEDTRVAKRDLVSQLLFINLIIAGGTAIAGFFLSGKTLEPIQKALDEQKRFVGDAAHELKTPIAALKTSLEVNLMDKKVKGEARKILKENLEDVENLESLTASLLKLARVNGQKIVLKPVCLSKVIASAVKTVSPLAKKNSIEIRVGDFPQNLNVKGDNGSLVDLFVIFLDNAIKYSPQKTVVSLKMQVKKDCVVIEVSDQGVGISKYHLPYIFNRFYRVDLARSESKTHGHGLGLSVAKKIVDEHGGKIRVESEAGKGTVFSVSLIKV